MVETYPNQGFVSQLKGVQQKSLRAWDASIMHQL
jgi:hypothetical protein